MSESEKNKKSDNNISYFKIKKEVIKSKRNNNLIIKKNTKILNIDKILSTSNFSLSRNRKQIQKSIIEEDLWSKKINGKSIGEDNPFNHKKNLTNIYNAETCIFKPELDFGFKEITEKKIFENKMHRRIQTERQSIEIKDKDKKINKIGNRHVLLNLLNLKNIKKNIGFTTEHLFKGKKGKTNINHNNINSTYLNLTVNKSFQKKNYIHKLNPSLINVKNEHKAKNNSNNFCMKSCNLESQYSKKKKIYPIKKRNRIVENIFKTQIKVRNNYNYYSQDNSISNIKSKNFNKNLNNIFEFPKRKIYLSSKVRQSLEFPKKYNFFSNSNNNTKSYTNSFDEDIKTKLLNTQKNNFQHQYISSVQKKSSERVIEKSHKKKTSNFNLKKMLINQIHNIFKDNGLPSNNLLSIKNNKLIYKTNSKSNEPKSLANKNNINTNMKTDSQFDYGNNQSKEKDKKLIKKNKILSGFETLQIKESIKIKNPLVTLNLKLNNDSKIKIMDYLNQKKIINHPINNLIKPKNFQFQSKRIIKIESLSKKGFWKPGKEKPNQDNYFLLNNINDNQKYIYIGVCDGHGIYGKEVSNYLINNLPQNLNHDIINSKIKYLSFESLNNLSTVIINSFIQTNNELINNKNIDTYLSGSTCASILFTPRRLISINVGDSRGILGKFNGEKWISKNLSRDHKPSDEDEKKRIIENGGRVEQNKDEFGNGSGPLRIWVKDKDIPGLAVSRTFGDELAHKIGVINEPEIEEYVFLNEDKFIILATDGLWEYISSDECVDFVKEYYLKNDIEGAINFLYKESSKRWIMEEDVIDDITLIVIFMN